MSDYTPTEIELEINYYVGNGHATGLTRGEGKRGLAKVKADALREAANDLIREAGLIPMPTSDHPAVRALRDRADRIQEDS